MAGLTLFLPFCSQHGCSAPASNKLVPGNPVGNLDAGGQENKRIMSEGHGHLAGLSRSDILLPLDPPVFAGRDIKTDRVLVVDHNPVGSPVPPPFLGITGDVDTARPDVAAAVVLVPLGSRKLKQIDFVIPVDVFK